MAERSHIRETAFRRKLAPAEITGFIEDNPLKMKTLVSARDGIVSWFAFKGRPVPQWAVPGSFGPNEVFDQVHGHSFSTPSQDVDLAYFDPLGTAEEEIELQTYLSNTYPDMQWDVKNQAIAHDWNNGRKAKDLKDALRYWPETVTGVGFTLNEEGRVEIVAPKNHLDDLRSGIVRPAESLAKAAERIALWNIRDAKRRWKKVWPGLQVKEPREFLGYLVT